MGVMIVVVVMVVVVVPSSSSLSSLLSLAASAGNEAAGVGCATLLGVPVGLAVNLVGGCITRVVLESAAL